MRLHLNKTLFRQSIQFTSDQMNILPIYIEKDYWVTYALFLIFNDPIGKETVFKGGTSLSKCFKMIERFSEDIDLVVLRKEGETNNQMTNKIKAIGKIVSDVLSEVEIEGLTQKMGMNRKTAHSYEKAFKGQYGQVRDVIVLEATWLGYFEPFTTKPLMSLIAEMMINNGQEKICAENGLMPFEVLVLEPTRTICEKIMSLVRFSYVNNPIEALKNKVRHAYDLHQLFQQKEFLDFFNSQEFGTMLTKVAQDDVISFKNNNKWLANPPKDALIFESVDKVWNSIKATYTNEFKNLVYGNLPEEKLIHGTLKQIAERLAKIEWSIDLN